MRLDSARVATDVDTLRRFLPQIMPTRTGAVLYFGWEIEVDAVEQLIAEESVGDGPPLRLFHVVLAAMLRTLVERPQLNRYVLGGRLFERSGISLTFSVKKGKRDDSRLVSTKVRFDPTDTLRDVQRKVDEAITRSRDPSIETTAEREMALLNRLPRPLVRRLLRGVQRLERLGLLPEQLTADDPMHTSAFVANLGSIGLDASFHHLSDNGTASLHATIGKVKPAVVVGPDRQPRVADVLDIKIAIDDRICDGFYCARSLVRLEHALRHPRALLQPFPRRPDLVPGRLWARAIETPEQPAYHTRSAVDGRWYATTWLTFRDEVRAAARALIALGVERGDCVAISGANRPEWTVAFLAASAIGAIPCGMHEDLAPSELAAALRLVRPRVVVLDALGPASLVREICDAVVVGMARRVIGEPVSPRTDRPAIAWDDLLEDGRALDDGEVERQLEGIRPEDPAVYVFTSGTTGEPRAAVLTHANVAWTADQAVQMLNVNEDDIAISYLPLSHVAEQSFTIHAAITSGGQVAYAPSRANILESIREVRPSVLFGVPQIWSRLRREAHEVEPKGARAWLGLDRVRYAISGAAGLDPELLAWFSGIGVELLETYGQTEGCGPTTFTRPGEARPGYAGRPFPGVEVAIAEDGEIRFRGPNAFAGYLDDPEATGAVLHEGWVYTGDLGAMDGGALRVLGRKRELLVTAGGEKVAPAPLEAALAALPLVAQAVVVGTGRPHLGALLALDQDAVVSWLRARGSAPVDAVEQHPDVVAEIGLAVEALNARRSRLEQIRAFRILPRLLTPEDGELTPTLKVRRSAVESRWGGLISELYGGPKLPPPAPVTEVAGFEVSIARASELDEVFALRFAAFSEQGLIETSMWPDGRMVDRFDAHAVHFVLRDRDGALVGTARLVPTTAEGLPVFELFEVDPLDGAGERTSEVGRLAIDARWRGRRAPLVALVRGALHHAKALGHERVYAFVPARAIRMYGALGLTVWELDSRPPGPDTLARRARMAPYFATQDPRIVVFTAPSM